MSCRDTHLVEKIKFSDRNAYKELFLKFYEPLCQFTWTYTRSRHISEELVQDVFLTVWELRENLNPEQNIRSYLYQSVRNSALNHIKHKRLAEEYNRDIEWLEPLPAVQHHSYEGNSNLEQNVKQAINDLPDGARRIYSLSRNEGLTYREIATVLDISIKTVESQMSRALRKMRNALSEYVKA